MVHHFADNIGFGLHQLLCAFEILSAEIAIPCQPNQQLID